MSSKPSSSSQPATTSPLAAAAAAAATDAANAAAAATAAAAAATSAARNAAAAAAAANASAAGAAAEVPASTASKAAVTSPKTQAPAAAVAVAVPSPVASPPPAKPNVSSLSSPPASDVKTASPRASPRSESKGSLSSLEAWTLKIDTIHAHSVNHFRDFLRWATEHDIITDDQFTRLISNMDQFIEVKDDSQPSMTDSLDDDEPVEPFNDDDEHSEPSATTRSTSVSGSSAESGTPSLPRSWSVGSDEDPAIQATRLANIAEAMEHPATGVKIGRRRHLLKHYHNVFVASEAVEWLIKNEHAKNVEEAVELGRKLAAKGYIAHVIGHSFENDKLFFRFTKHPQSFSLKVLPNSTKCGSWHASVLSLVYHVHENNVLDWMDTVNPEYMKHMYPAVLLWAKQNEELHTEVARRLFAMTEKNRAVRLAFMAFTKANGECVGKKFDCKPSDVEINTIKMVEAFPPSKAIKHFQESNTMVSHPFTADLCTVELRKEFVSSAKPAWMKLYKVSGDGKEKIPVLPDVIAKVGDDLRKDLCVQLVFRACESFWAAANETWVLGAAPRVATTQVMAVGPVNGYIEFVKGRTIKEVAETNSWKDVDLVKLAPTMVGSMISGFVLGVRDRHSENWMLLDEKDDPKLMQIDFGYMLMENPGGLPLDTPRLTMQPELVKLLKEKQTRDGRTLMDDIRTDLITAYKVLRTHHPALVSFAKIALSAVYAPDQVESFMWGKHCFRSGQSDAKALAWFDDKVRSQLKSVVWRRSAKHALVKAYYGVKTAIAAMPGQS